jgi:hypothetical protein
MYTHDNASVGFGEERCLNELFSGETLKSIGAGGGESGKFFGDIAREGEVSGALRQTGEALRDMKNAAEGNLMDWRTEDIQHLKDAVHGKLRGMREITGEAWQIFLRALSGDASAIRSVVDRNLTHDFRLILGQVSPDKIAIVLDALCAVDPRAAELLQRAEIAGRALSGDADALHELTDIQSRQQSVVMRAGQTVAQWLSGGARRVDEKAGVREHYDSSLAALVKQYDFMTPELIRDFIATKIRK